MVGEHPQKCESVLEPLPHPKDYLQSSENRCEIRFLHALQGLRCHFRDVLFGRMDLWFVDFAALAAGMLWTLPPDFSSHFRDRNFRWHVCRTKLPRKITNFETKMVRKTTAEPPQMM